MREISILGDHLTALIENGVPLCVGGANMAIVLEGTTPNLPTWVTRVASFSQEELLRIQAGELLQACGYIIRRLHD